MAFLSSTAPFLLRHDHFIESSKDKDIFLRLREVSPTIDGDSFKENSASRRKNVGSEERLDKTQAILFVHGAVLPSIIFDVPVKGASWLDYYAEQGIHAFALDLRGYGRSTKPKAMDLAEKEAPVVCTHYDALSDIADAIDYIRAKLKVDKVILAGLSWGSLLVGAYTHLNQHLVSHLVLIGPVYSYKNPLWSMFMNPQNSTELHPSLGGYRVIQRHMLHLLWDADIPFEDKSLWRSEDVFNAIIDDVMQNDYTWASAHDSDAIRSPCGVLHDVLALYNGHNFYPAEEIAVPTLILRGDHDRSSHPEDMRHFFERLGNSVHGGTIKQYVQIGSASHYALVEKRAPYLMAMSHGFVTS